MTRLWDCPKLLGTQGYLAYKKTENLTGLKQENPPQDQGRAPDIVLQHCRVLRGRCFLRKKCPLQPHRRYVRLCVSSIPGSPCCGYLGYGHIQRQGCGAPKVDSVKPHSVPTCTRSLWVGRRRCMRVTPRSPAEGYLARHKAPLPRTLQDMYAYA